MKSRDINFRQRTFYSDKNIRKADYRVVTVFQYNLFGDDEEPIKISKTRNGKEKLTCPAKQILNDKKSELYFELLLKGNFSENDYVLRLSYSDKYLPATEEEAEENVKKYIRDLRKAAKKRGIEMPITELVYRICYEKFSVRTAIKTLMGRAMKRE